MKTPNILIEEELCRFLKKYGDNQVKRELLYFWGRHSEAHFSSNVICRVLDCSKSKTEHLLQEMVEEGLLDNYVANNVTLYSLTTNQEKRRPIMELTALGWDQQNNMIKHMRLRNILKLN